MIRMIGVELTAREKDILKVLVSQYIACGEPISSRFLSKMERFPWSPATIRNVMMDLEEKGFLEQPHVSAGRVPSDKGFRFYIHELIHGGLQSPRFKSQIRNTLSGNELPRVMEAVPKLIASLSHQIGLIIAPHFGHIPLKSMDFIPVDAHQILVVLVARSGNILNKLIQVNDGFSRSELLQISNFLNSRYSGKTLHQIRKTLMEAPVPEGLDGRLIPASLGVSDRLIATFSEDEDFLMEADLSHDAAMHLMVRIRQSLKDRDKLLHILSSCIEHSSTQVVLGEESQFTAKHGCAVVASSYALGDISAGAVGIIGPKAMPYHLVIPLVEETAKLLTQKMTVSGETP
jgi:heat-inducible transcriptional repressor